MQDACNNMLLNSVILKSTASGINTYPLDKMSAKLQIATLSAMSSITIGQFIFFSKMCPLGCNWWVIIGLDNGLAPNGQQAIIYANDDPVQWCIYVAVRGDKQQFTMNQLNSLNGRKV